MRIFLGGQFYFHCEGIYIKQNKTKYVCGLNSQLNSEFKIMAVKHRSESLVPIHT